MGTTIRPYPRTRLWRTAPEQRYGYLAWDQPASLALLNWGVLFRNLRKRVPDRVYRTEQRVVALREHGDGTVGAELADGAVHEDALTRHCGLPSRSEA